LKNSNGNNCGSTIKVLGWIDLAVIVILVTATTMSIPLLNSHQPGTVLVYLDNVIVARYPIDNDKVFSIRGIEGPISIEIKNRHVSVINSSCIRHICMQAGTISHPYQQIVCAPNHVLITIRLPKKSAVDAIAN